MIGGFFGTRNVMIALSLAIVAIAAVVGAIFLLNLSQSKGASRGTVIAIALVDFCGLLDLVAPWLGRDRGSSVMGRGPTGSRNALAGIVVAFALFFGAAGAWVVWTAFWQSGTALAKSDDDNLELTQMIPDIPAEQPTPDEGTAGMAKGNGGGSKPKHEKAGGGGGGGRQEKTDASNGKLPQAHLQIPQVVSPHPHPPPIKNPPSPIPPTIHS